MAHIVAPSEGLRVKQTASYIKERYGFMTLMRGDVYDAEMTFT